MLRASMQRLINQAGGWGQGTGAVRLLILVAAGLAVVIFSVQTALAAVQLNFFNVISYPTSVTLEWSTASEVGVAAFDVKCKEANAPESDYHSIGLVQTKGGPNVGALYTFPVTSGVTPGVAYCFRLQEITTDGSQGEAIDRCGYGPAVTPTPGLGAILTFTPVPTLPFGVTPTPALPPAVPTDPFGFPIVTPTLPPPGQPVDPFQSPLPTPFNPGFPTPIIPATTPLDPFQSPLPTPFDPGFPTPILPSSAMADPSSNPLADPLAVVLPPAPAVATVDPMAAAGVQAVVTEAPIPPPESAAAARDVPAAETTPEYVVVTATPTQPPVAVAQVMTPLPTATPMPGTLQVADALAPTTQNLMIMLLCLTFTGAGGIGILGLITSVMYMRARTSQRDFYDQYSRRR